MRLDCICRGTRITEEETVQIEMARRTTGTGRTKAFIFFPWPSRL